MSYYLNRSSFLFSVQHPPPPSSYSIMPLVIPKSQSPTYCFLFLLSSVSIIPIYFYYLHPCISRKSKCRIIHTRLSLRFFLLIISPSSPLSPLFSIYIPPPFLFPLTPPLPPIPLLFHIYFGVSRHPYNLRLHLLLLSLIFLLLFLLHLLLLLLLFLINLFLFLLLILFRFLLNLLLFILLFLLLIILLLLHLLLSSSSSSCSSKPLPRQSFTVYRVHPRPSFPPPSSPQRPTTFRAPPHVPSRAAPLSDLACGPDMSPLRKMCVYVRVCVRVCRSGVHVRG